jgi:replicative DNA helicase
MNASAYDTLHDETAERTVLGQLLTYPDSAVPDVQEKLQSEDFYVPAHGTIYLTILTLVNEGAPVTVPSVVGKLRSTGELSKVGGMSYLAELTTVTVVPSNAAYYAEIVTNYSHRRKLYQFALKATFAAGNVASGTVNELLSGFQNDLDSITNGRTGSGVQALSDSVMETLEHIETLQTTQGQRGIPTGFVDVDKIIPGLNSGQFVIVAGRPAMGKALAVTTPIYTPNGWVTMGDIKPGDEVFSPTGLPVKVAAVTEEMLNRVCYNVTFSDGETIVADAEHLWRVNIAADSPARDWVAVLKTENLTGNLVTRSGGVRYQIPATEPLQHPHEVIEPNRGWYEEGVRFAASCGVRTVNTEQRSPFVPVHVPKGAVEPFTRILVAPLAAKLAFLRGAAGQSHTAPFATVGWFTPAGVVAETLSVLLCSIGFVFVETFTETVTNHGNIKEMLFTLTGRGDVRDIVSVTVTDSVPVKCIEVVNADGMFLAGKRLIPTHNSALGLNVAQNAALNHNKSVYFATLEMSHIEVTMRLISSVCKVPLSSIMSGNMTDNDWDRIGAKLSAIQAAKLFIDDSPSANLPIIHSKARRLQQKSGLDLVVVDYLQLMSSVKRTESRQQEVSEMSRGFKLMAKELAVPVIAMSQLNRGSETRTDKRPQMSDLRESGSLEQDADVIILLHREEYYDENSPRKGEADVIVAKNRMGPSGTVVLSWLGGFTTFENFANPGHGHAKESNGNDWVNAPAF